MNDTDQARRVSASRFFTIGAVAATLLIATLLLAIGHKLHTLSAETTSTLKAHIVLEPGTDRVAAAPLASELEAWTGVAAVEFRDGATNLAFLEAETGESLSAFTPATVPSSLELTFDAPEAVLLDARGSLEALQSRPGVVGIEMSRPDVVALASAFEPMSLAALLLVLLALVIGVVVVAHMQGVNAIGRKDELQVMRQLGARDAQVTWPFYRESLINGFIGAAIVAGALVGALAFGAGGVEWLVGGIEVESAVLAGSVAAVIVVAGLFVSFAGAHVCVLRFVRRLEGVA